VFSNPAAERQQDVAEVPRDYYHREGQACRGGLEHQQERVERIASQFEDHSNREIVFWDSWKQEWRRGRFIALDGAQDIFAFYDTAASGNPAKKMPLERIEGGKVYYGNGEGWQQFARRVPEMYDSFRSLDPGDNIILRHPVRNAEEQVQFLGFKYENGRLYLIFRDRACQIVASERFATRESLLTMRRPGSPPDRSQLVQTGFRNAVNSVEARGPRTHLPQPADWPQMVEGLNGAFGVRAGMPANQIQARRAEVLRVAHELCRALDDFGIRVRKELLDMFGYHREGNANWFMRDLSRTTDYPQELAQLDVKLAGFLRELKGGAIEALLRQGKHPSTNNLALTMGKADINGWITPQGLADASYALRRKAAVSGLEVINPDFIQTLPGMTWAEAAQFLHDNRLKAGDRNLRMIYVEEIAGNLEERYHAVQNLLAYAYELNVMRTSGALPNGTAGGNQYCNVSGFARSPNNPTRNRMMGIEGDVFARICELFGNLPDHWLNYGERAEVPRPLIPLDTPGLLDPQR